MVKMNNSNEIKLIPQTLQVPTQNNYVDNNKNKIIEHLKINKDLS